MLMNLIVDQGNTATKLALFNEEKEVVRKKSFQKTAINEINQWVNEHTNPGDFCLISSVTNDNLQFSHLNTVAFDKRIKLPVHIAYKTPKTLGKDRIANAVAVWRKNPNAASLAIDLGTCIKYDIVNGEGVYLGGNISPGLKMRYRALHEFTDKLPLIQPEIFDFGYGDTTVTSMMNGVQHAILHEINGFIERYQEQFGELTIFMSGGDLKYFDKRYKNTIFADSNLTLYGLNEILKYNVEE